MNTPLRTLVIYCPIEHCKQLLIELKNIFGCVIIDFKILQQQTIITVGAHLDQTIFNIGFATGKFFQLHNINNN